MSSAFLIRRAESYEHDRVRTIMKTVIQETYGDLGAEAWTQIEHEDVSGAWLSVDDAEIVGVALTHDCWLSDLWILRDYRGRGAGMLLLARSLQEIANHRCAIAFLRVVKSNTRAVAFYQRSGWIIEAEFPHETLPLQMLRMSKAL